MLRKLLARFLGINRERNKEAAKHLDELKTSVQKDLSFLSADYGFVIADERYVGRGACFLILENDFMRLRVAEGGEFGGYDWSIGDKDAEIIFEKGLGWLNVLRFVNDKLGGNESLPREGLKSWESTPLHLLHEMYARLLSDRMAEVSQLFKTYRRVADMPEHSERS